MMLFRQQLQPLIARQNALIGELASLYAEMDARYAALAATYGFDCRGCEDNCCLTRFDHHTLIEVAFLYKGFLALPHAQQRHILRRAYAYGRALQEAPRAGKPFRRLCPLNQDTRCLLYAQRPMICRLHGIPHVLRHPRKGLIAGTGCHIFESSGRPTHEKRLDRTPLYAALARLESARRRASGMEMRVCLTVAEMIVGFAEMPSQPTGDEVSDCKSADQGEAET